MSKPALPKCPACEMNALVAHIHRDVYSCLNCGRFWTGIDLWETPGLRVVLADAK